MIVMELKRGAIIDIQGIVQGVGFRPFIRNWAVECNLSGWVYNYSGGVKIKIEGRFDDIDRFYSNLEEKAPPAAIIIYKKMNDTQYEGYEGFTIKNSHREKESFTMISPDLSICPDCQQELLAENDRRYQYPFINCTNCGPRYTIIENLPYDRPETTMRDFIMCPDCQNEYEDAANRRYHAQPNACPACGPQLIFQGKEEEIIGEKEPIEAAVEALNMGKIVAIKGLGGFHLACDATNQKAVEGLRNRKLRPTKPLAVMVGKLEELKDFVYITPEAEKLLKSPAHPIVTLQGRPGNKLAEAVAPGLKEYGVFLPYTPLHVLLFGEQANYQALVMTSANLTDKALIYRNEEINQQIGQLCDFILTHNRRIQTRCDDSVFRIIGGRGTCTRRGRGYAPLPVRICSSSPDILACGTDLKNTVCVVKDGFGFLSQHIGDLGQLSGNDYFRETIEKLKNLFKVQPEYLACDLHPGYFSHNYAREFIKESSGKEGSENNYKNVKKLIQVQHHHAHLVSCMVENELDEKVLGVVFDGTGYGTDGNIWGGEFLISDRKDFQRVAYFNYIPLLGGEKAIKAPYRMALSYLFSIYEHDNMLKLDWQQFINTFSRRLINNLQIDSSAKLNIFWQMYKQGINSPLTSSAGRLFAAVSAMLGLCPVAEYEGEAAMKLEASIDIKAEGSYGFEILEDKQQRIINTVPLIQDIISDFKQGVEIGVIALRFHNTIAEIIRKIAIMLYRETSLNKVLLSGGVFQNKYLTERVIYLLKKTPLQVFRHKDIPPNDGGIALGQAAVAIKRSDKGCV